MLYSSTMRKNLTITIIVITVLAAVGFFGMRTLQKNQTNRSAIENVALPQTDTVKIIKYDQANAEQKVFLDRITREYSAFQRDKLVLFYFDPVKNIAVVGSIPPNVDSSGNYEKNNLTVGFFHPESADPAQFHSGGLFVVTCKDALTLSSSCSYMTDKYLVFFVADDSVGPGGGSILAYKAGDVSYNEKLLKESSDSSLGGTYVKEYDANKVPILDTSFDGKTITASLYKDNQYLGMGYFDLTKTNEKLRTVTFELN